MVNQKGQVILILILVMTVALAIGLSIVQKSLVDVSTASKVEQSSRAFSAAEAGIEKALQLNSSTSVSSTSVDFSENASRAEAINSGLIPEVPPANNRQAALEFPPLAKEDTAQVWFANLDSTTNPPPAVYTQNSLDVYWGDPLSEDKAALELTLVYHDGTKYTPKKWYLDQVDRGNGFAVVGTCTDNGYRAGANVYRCSKSIGFTPQEAAGLMLLRARLLYNSTSQPFAVQPPSTATCGAACSLPPQAREIESTGVSGETQRKINVFQLYKVVPPFFDYAIFSAGDITK